MAPWHLFNILIIPTGGHRLSQPALDCNSTTLFPVPLFRQDQTRHTLVLPHLLSHLLSSPFAASPITSHPSLAR